LILEALGLASNAAPFIPGAQRHDAGVDSIFQGRFRPEADIAQRLN